MATEKDAGVMDGIMLWVGAVILIVIMLPVISGIIGATPIIVTNPLDVGNLTGGGGVLGPAGMNTTQTTIYTTAANSFNLIGIVPIVIAAVVILGVVALLGFRRG